MKKLKIGTITFKVKQGGISDGQMGCVLYDKSEIRIRKGLERQIARQTLLHEIIHIILMQSGNLDNAQDEGLIETLAYGLLDFVSFV